MNVQNRLTVLYVLVVGVVVALLLLQRSALAWNRSQIDFLAGGWG